MDRITGRPNHIEDFLARHHENEWYTYTDFENRIYANVILKEQFGVDGVMVNNPHSLPTEQECIDGLKALQDEWDLEHNSYKSQRRAKYGSWNDQLDEIYHDIDAWKARLQTIKTNNPKS
jgi:hypothetical protein